MASTRRKTKREQFVDDMIRLRGIEFAQVGMNVEVDGEMGTIVRMNAGANVDVRFANQLQKYRARARNLYFNPEGNVIAQYGEVKCVFRTDAASA